MGEVWVRAVVEMWVWEPEIGASRRGERSVGRGELSVFCMVGVVV